MQVFLDPNYKPKYKELEQELKNFGFYHSRTDVYRMYAEYVNNGQYGYAGGVLDQPSTYWHDMAVMRKVHAFVQHYLPFAVNLPDEAQYTIEMFRTGKIPA
jgi:hypothetical protein